ADERVFLSRRRAYFYKYVPRQFAELSIKGATHEDAQYPSRRALDMFGFDPFTDEELQQKFSAAIAVAAYSLSTQGDLSYAWKAYADEFKSGAFLNAKKK